MAAFSTVLGSRRWCSLWMCSCTWSCTSISMKLCQTSTESASIRYSCAPRSSGRSYFQFTKCRQRRNSEKLKVITTINMNRRERTTIKVMQSKAGRFPPASTRHHPQQSARPCILKCGRESESILRTALRWLRRKHAKSTAKTKTLTTSQSMWASCLDKRIRAAPSITSISATTLLSSRRCRSPI